ncbi:10368_t:CDS:2 [Entrophospora sp. SA101]|nr:10368_t:CDS:2 [Entrophospora sp. SA101]
MELAQCKDENEDLSQMVINLHRDLETQSKEIESKLQDNLLWKIVFEQRFDSLALKRRYQRKQLLNSDINSHWKTWYKNRSVWLKDIINNNEDQPDLLKLKRIQKICSENDGKNTSQLELARVVDYVIRLIAINGTNLAGLNERSATNATNYQAERENGINIEGGLTRLEVGAEMERGKGGVNDGVNDYEGGDNEGREDNDKEDDIVDVMNFIDNIFNGDVDDVNLFYKYNKYNHNISKFALYILSMMLSWDPNIATKIRYYKNDEGLNLWKIITSSVNKDISFEINENLNIFYPPRGRILNYSLEKALKTHIYFRTKLLTTDLSTLIYDYVEPPKIRPNSKLFDGLYELNGEGVKNFFPYDKVKNEIIHKQEQEQIIVIHFNGRGTDYIGEFIIYDGKITSRAKLSFHKKYINTNQNPWIYDGVLTQIGMLGDWGEHNYVGELINKLNISMPLTGWKRFAKQSCQN